MRCTRPSSTALNIPPAASIRRNDRLDFCLHLVGQRLDVVRAAQRIDDVGQLRLFAQNVLRGDRDSRGFGAGYRHRFVVAVGMQRLQTAEDARHRLRGDARDVVQRLLARQVDARCLSVELEAP